MSKPMPYEFPVLDVPEELDDLLSQSADQTLQDGIIEVLESRQRFKNDERYSGIANLAIRATSPHVFTIYNYYDRDISILNSKFNEAGVQLCPTSREGGTFGFNLGIDCFNQLASKEEELPRELAAEIISHLEPQTAYFDHGDLPGWMGVARVDNEGGIIANIRNSNARYSERGSGLSAYFSENAAEGTSQDYATMSGLWVLGLALKVQQASRAEGSHYHLSDKVWNHLEDNSVASFARALLKLDR